MKQWWTVFLLTFAFAIMALFQGSLAETVTLPNGLTAVEEEAFFGDASLEAVLLPEGIETIGSKAFAGTGLTAIDLPVSLKIIADDAFDGPEKVSVTAEKGSYAYRWAVANGYIASPFTYTDNDDGTLTITGYTGEDAEFDIPDVISGKTVTAIGDGAFRSNTVLTQVTLPDTLKVVGAGAFDGCSGMRRPYLPFGLLEIRDRAFYGCSGYSLSLPRTLTFIGDDAFTGYRFLNVYEGSYAAEWALPLAEQDSYLRYAGLYIANVSISTDIAIPGEQVTCTAERIDEYIESMQWQRSFDGINWTDCEGERANTPEYAFIASPETCCCVYRLAGTDISGTYFTEAASVGYLADDLRISSAYVSGTNISLGWGTSWEGIHYTLYMTGPDGEEAVLAENIEENFYDATGLEPETAYTFRLTASYGENTVSGVPVTVTTQNYRTGTVYRALLVGQVHFQYASEECPDSIGDLNLMGNMLQHVEGPQGSAYSITRKTDLTVDQVHQAIQTTFADADEDDVSLFFIATHGLEDDYLEEEYIGALICYNPSTRRNEYIKDTTLAAWLSEIPGEVVVILEACSSGSAIYDSGEENASGNGVTLSAMNSAAISAFQSADQTLSLGGVRLSFDEEGNAVEAPPMLRIGGLRQTKFHVITSSAHLEYSYAMEEAPFPHTIFTYGFTQGIGLSGSMPCDTNRDDSASMRELVSYIGSFVDPYLPKYTQHVQAYPANSDYVLFFRED